jgi:hypothetical protein
MNKTYTLNSLALFIQNEEKLLNSLELTVNTKQGSPSRNTIKNILAYSKALSIKKSLKFRAFCFYAFSCNISTQITH